MFILQRPSSLAFAASKADDAIERKVISVEATAGECEDAGHTLTPGYQRLGRFLVAEKS